MRLIKLFQIQPPFDLATFKQGVYRGINLATSHDTALPIMRSIGGESLPIGKRADIDINEP